MRALPATAEFVAAARRIVWFKRPEEALARPLELLAYALRYASDEDMGLLLGHVGMEGIAEALSAAPPGIIDARSWAYWNAKVGRYPAPPMPRRIMAEPIAEPDAGPPTKTARSRR